MTIPRTICFLLLGGGAALLVSGCAARLDSAVETKLDALAQTSAAIASNVSQTKQELSTQVAGVGNKINTITQNFDPATMNLIVRGALYLCGGIAILLTASLILTIAIARCRYPKSCPSGARK